MIDVVVAKGEVAFPPICPMCLRQGAATKLRVSDTESGVSCDVTYCGKCSRRVGWYNLWPVPWWGPRVRVRQLGNKSLLLQFSSARYAATFLEMNPTAFIPERGWRWRPKAKKCFAYLLKFAVAYSLYLGIFLPIAHADMVEVVPWIGIPFAAAGVYVWARLAQRKE